MNFVERTHKVTLNHPNTHDVPCGYVTAAGMMYMNTVAHGLQKISPGGRCAKLTSPLHYLLGLIRAGY
jgi:hypothetical protein